MKCMFRDLLLLPIIIQNIGAVEPSRFFRRYIEEGSFIKNQRQVKLFEPTKTSRIPPEVVFLVYGQIARANCIDNSIRQQFVAIKSQRDMIFSTLSRLGYRCRLLISTNSCKLPDWELNIRRAYGDLIDELVLSDCSLFPEQRCHLHVSFLINL